MRVWLLIAIVLGGAPGAWAQNNQQSNQANSQNNNSSGNSANQQQNNTNTSQKNQNNDEQINQDYVEDFMQENTNNNNSQQIENIQGADNASNINNNIPSLNQIEDIPDDTGNETTVETIETDDDAFDAGDFSIGGQGNTPEKFDSPPNQVNTKNANTIQEPVIDSTLTPAEELPDGPSAPQVDQEAAANNEFAGAPPIFGTRRRMAFGEAPEEYEIQPGDTLYDVCDQLIDEADYWPKLWAMNPEIRNPHFIYPGFKVKFFPGDKVIPPFLQLVTEDDVVPIDKGTLKEPELIREDVSGLLLRFAGQQPVPIVGPNDITGNEDVGTRLEVIGDIPRPNSVTVSVPAFFFRDEPEFLGEVIGGVSGSILTDKNDEIVLREKGKLARGMSYTVLRESGMVYDPESNDRIGRRYEFVAHIRVTDSLGEGGNYVGNVLENRLGVQPGDLLVAYRATGRVVSLAGGIPAGGGANKVIGFAYPNSLIGGQGSTVFFENRSGQSLSVGSVIAVHQKINRSASEFIRGRLPNIDREIAIVRIIDNSEIASVGYIINSKREVQLGDRAGKG